MPAVISFRAKAALGAVGYVSEGKAQAALRQEIAQLNAQPGAIVPLRGENQRLAYAIAEVEMLRRDDVESERLAQDVARARQRQAISTFGPWDEMKTKMREDYLRARQEVERLNQEGQALVKEYRDWSIRVLDASLTPEARAQAEKAAQAKSEQVRKRQQELKAFVENVRLALRIAAPDLFITSRSGPEEKSARLVVNKSAVVLSLFFSQFGSPPRRRMNRSVRRTTFSHRFARGGKPLGTLTHPQVRTVTRLALYDLRGGPANPKSK